MSSPAQVESVAAIGSFRVSLAKFEQRAQDALDTLTGELRRALDWLEHNRPGYWKEQIRLAMGEVHQAKLDLERCLMFPVADERPACREEKSNLKKAQDHLEYCREKRELVKHWNRQLEHELFEYEGRIGHLQRLLETEMPTAKAKLQQITRRLDAYRVERPPAAMESLDEKMTEANEDAE